MSNIIVENPYADPVEIPAHLPKSYTPKEDVEPRPAEAAAGPLTSEHHQQLAEAAERVKKLAKVSKVASFNGWSTGFFAVCCIPFAPFSLTSAIMGVILGVVAWNEFRGKKLFQQFDTSSTRLLGWNQVGFMSALIGYSIWMVLAVLFGPSPYEEQFRENPELRNMVGDVEQLYVAIAVGIYGMLVVFALLFQGLNALYYFSRAKHLQAYIDETPAWVLDVQRASVS